MVSKNVLVGISKSLTTAEKTNLTEGITIYQENNANFRGNLSKVLGAIGIGLLNLFLQVLVLDLPMLSTSYNNVPLISRIGRGSGAKVNLTVNSGVSYCGNSFNWWNRLCSW